MGDPGTGLGGNRNRFGGNHPGLGYWLNFGLGNWSLGHNSPGGRGDRSVGAKAAGGRRCSRAGLICRTFRLLGSEVGNVQGALAVGKFFDAKGMDNIGKQH